MLALSSINFTGIHPLFQIFEVGVLYICLLLSVGFDVAKLYWHKINFSL